MTTAPVCDCEPTDVFGDGDISEHRGDCPRYWGHLATAESIATMRGILMHLDDLAAQLLAAGDASFSRHRERTARLVFGVTARAVELGLEAP